MAQYIEVAIGSCSNRGFIINRTALVHEIQKARSAGLELYRSYYLYDDEVLEHMKISKSVRGYKGKYYVEKLVFDIDKGTNTDDFLLRRVQEFCSRLIDDYKLDQELIRVFFSGRGWHVQIPDIFHFEPSNYMPKEVANTLTQYFPEADNIYDGARLLRATFTVNSKSGLFKTVFTYDELMEHKDFSWFKEFASDKEKSFRKIPAPMEGEIDVNYFNLIVKEKADRIKESLADAPSGMVTCVQNMYAKGPITGTRHNTMLRMVSSFRRQGTPKGIIEAGLIQWARGMEPYEVKRMVDSIYNSPIRYSCNDPVMQKHCSVKCVYWRNKNYLLEVISKEDREKNFTRFVRTDYKSSAFDLNEVWDIGSGYMMYPGESIIILGDTGLGKSAALMTMMVKMKRLKILDLQLENDEQLETRRLVQIDKQMSKKEVYDYYRTHDTGLMEGINHIKTVTIGPEISAIRKLIAEGEYQLVCIDPIDGLKVNGIYDPNSKLEAIGVELKEIAKAMNVIVIGIHHLSKNSSIDEKGRPKRLNVHSGKGASALEQKADKVLAIEGDRDGSIRMLTSLKARDEEPFETQLLYDKKTLTYKSIPKRSENVINHEATTIADSISRANVEITELTRADV